MRLLLVVFIASISTVNSQYLVKSELTPTELIEDIEFLHEKYLSVHPNVHFRVSREKLDRAFEIAQMTAQSRNNDQNVVEIMRLIALVEDGHSSISRSFEFQQSFIPIRPYLFDDGLFIMEAQDPDLRGAEILAINHLLIDDVFDKISTIIPADNLMHKKNVFPYKIIIPELLFALGIGSDSKSVLLKIQKNGKLSEVKLQGGSAQDWHIWMHHLTPADNAPVFRKFNPFSSEENTLYWMQWLTQYDLLYMQMKEVISREDYPMNEFAKDLKGKLESAGKFVLDLRECSGGNKGIYPPLLRTIKDSPVNEYGRLFIITGRRTNSAATSLVTDLKSQTAAIIIGEALGGSPNYYSDVINYHLPNSGIPVSISTRYQSDSYYADTRRTHLADISIPYKSFHYFNNEDPVLNYILSTDLQREYIKPEIDPAILGSYQLDPLNKVSLNYDGEKLLFSSEGLFDLILEKDTSGLNLVPVNGYDLSINLDDQQKNGLKVFLHNKPYLLHSVDHDFYTPIELLKSGEVSKGLIKIDEIVKDYPNLHIVPESSINSIGYHLLRNGYIKEAIKVFKKNTELWPYSHNVWDSLGEAYFEAGDLEKALTYYMKALAIYPESPTALKMVEKIQASYNEDH